MDYVLQSQNLVKSFGKVKAVDNVNIHVPKGSIYGLVGRKEFLRIVLSSNKSVERTM